MNIGIVDDHPIIISAYCDFLSDEFNCTLSGSDGLEMIKQFNELQIERKNDIPEIVIVDLRMPNMDGIACINWLKENYPDIKIIVISMFSEPDAIIQTVQLGIKSYVCKDELSPEILKEAVREVSNGNKYFTKKVASILADGIEKSTKPHYEASNLSRRETEIVKLVGQGLTSAEISDILLLSKTTVDTHRKNILKKLNLQGKTELINYSRINNIGNGKEEQNR